MRELASRERRATDTAAATLLSLLESSGGSYCILHGWRSLTTSDLDIAIAPRDLGKLLRAVHRMEGTSVVQIVKHEATCNYFVLAIGSCAPAGFLVVDTATDYRRDGRVFFAIGEMLALRRRWNGLWVAAPAVEFKYLIVKKTLKGGFPPHQRERLQELARELDVEGEEIGRRLFGDRLGGRLLEWVKSGRWGMVEKHLGELRRALRWQQVKRDPLNPVRYWLPEIPRLIGRWCNPTGLLVAILGLDGAGKSTLIQCLREDLAGAFRKTAVFHLAPGLLYRKNNQASATYPHGRPPRPVVVSLLKLAYFWLDYALGYCFKVRPALARSTLVLFDRYFDDLLVDPRRYRFQGPMELPRWIRRFIPRPDIFVLLDLPAEVAHSRKPEVSIEDARTLRARYLNLAHSLRNAHIVNASKAPEEVAADVEQVLLGYMKVRTRRRLGPFRSPDFDA